MLNMVRDSSMRRRTWLLTIEIILVFIVCLIPNTISVYTQYDGWNRPLNTKSETDGYQRYSKFWDLAQAAKKSSVGREELVQHTLQEAAGVYRNKELGKSMGLGKTVLTTVLSYPKKRLYFKHYFRNFLCFTQSYEYDLVVFVTRDQGDNYQTHLTHVEEINKLGVRALPYPEELHYLLVYGKSEPISAGRKAAPYSDDYPNFLSYGALVMLVPTYEIIRSGYNAIYFDVDIALIVDPIPHLTLGDADFVTSMENKECIEVAYAADVRHVKWDEHEFNTGIMMLRATKTGIQFMTDWLERLVDLNLMNDQQVLDRSFKRYHSMTYASNCLPPNTIGVIPTIPSIRDTPESPTYCFLSDILFQNGKTALSCTKAVHMLSYTRNMILGAIPSSQVTSSDHAPSADTTAIGKFRDIITGTTNEVENVYYMTTVHVNFSGGKSDELRRRRLWLYHHHNNVSDNDVFDSARPFAPHAIQTEGQFGHFDPHDNSLSCSVYNLSRIHYTTSINFREVYLEHHGVAIKEFHEFNKTGILLKRSTGREIFLMGNDSKLHAFPNGGTFVKMGFEWGQEKNIPDYLMSMFTVGNVLPDLDNAQVDIGRTKHDALMEAKQKSLKGTEHFFVTFGVFSSPNINMNDTRWGAS